VTVVAVPSSVDVLDVAEAAALFVEREAGYVGESPWEYQRGVAAALAWVRGEGPRPDAPAWCDPCGGHGSVGGAECAPCGGSGVAR